MKIAGIVAIVLTALHALLMLSVLGNIAFAIVTHTGFAKVTHARTAFEDGQRVGNAIAFLWTGLTGIVGLVLGPLTAWALLAKRSFARRLLWASAIFNLVSCWCFPFGGYFLYVLMRSDVKKELASYELRRVS